MRLKLGEMTAIQIAQHNGLVQIVNAVFGGGDDKAKRPENIREKYRDVTEGAGSVEEAVARINKLLSF